MAKTLAGILAVTMAALLFTGCGGGNGGEAKSDVEACRKWEVYKSNPSAGAPAGADGFDRIQAMESGAAELVTFAKSDELRDAFQSLYALFLVNNVDESLFANRSQLITSICAYAKK